MRTLAILALLLALSLTFASVGNAEAPSAYYIGPRYEFTIMIQSWIEELIEENIILRNYDMSEDEQMIAIHGSPLFQTFEQQSYNDGMQWDNSEWRAEWFLFFVRDFFERVGVNCHYDPSWYTDDIPWCDSWGLWKEPQFEHIYSLYVAERTNGTPFTYHELDGQLDVMIEVWLSWCEPEMTPEEYETERASFHVAHRYANRIMAWYNQKPQQPRMMLESWLEFTGGLFNNESIGGDGYYHWLLDNFSELTGWPVWRTPFDYGIVMYDVALPIVAG